MTLKSLVLAALLCSLPIAVPAADVTDIAKLRLSNRLFEVGIETQDPLYLIAAARLRRSIPLTMSLRAPTGGSAEEGAPWGWQEMLDEAAEMAAGDPTLEGLIEDVIAERPKGVRGGPVVSVISIRPGGADTYPQVAFAGGKYAEVYVEGPRGADLNVAIRDSRGRLVCSDTDISMDAYCGWHPKADEAFEIIVTNDGKTGGRYSLTTN